MRAPGLTGIASRLTFGWRNRRTPQFARGEWQLLAAASSRPRLESSWIRLPERTLHALMQLDGREVRVATYHAPPGVSWLERKPQQAVAFAAWLGTSVGPVILGADANTPLVDHPDFALTRTHWHTGDRHLRGAPGDDCLWAASKTHGLRDALRRWLDDHPDDLAAIVRDRPAGPLAISHYTGRRKTHRGAPRRFDSIWVSGDFNVSSVAYPYDTSVAAGSDHSAVVGDLSFVDS